MFCTLAGAQSVTQIINGGTGANSASGARTNLGVAPSASPTFTGTMTIPVTGAIQCLHVSSSGVVSGTGSDCGAGGGMTWPAAPGIAVYAGSSAWGTSLTAPTGAIVGTSDTQTLTNKTVDGVTPTTFGYVDPTSSIQTQLNAKSPSASPTFSGTVTLPVTGSIQCLHVSTLGVVSGTGTDCGSGGGGWSTVYGIQNISPWSWNHDAGTPGTSTGNMTMGISSPSLSGHAAQFDTTFTGYGGEVYFNSVFSPDDAISNQFLYDTYVYIPSSAAGTVGNLEFDLNQVLADGTTVIFGFQCDGLSSGKWDYTENSGTDPIHYVDSWIASTVPCDPSTWSLDTWHHVVISYQRDSSGNVTYNSVTFDGAYSAIGATVNSDFALGWTPVGLLLTNFQMDGNGSGSNTIYLDDLNISRSSGGGSMIYPGAGIAVSTGSAWDTSLTAPVGALVGTTDTQVVTNKTVDGVTPTTFGYLDPTSSVQTQLNTKVPTITTVNGHALSANVTVTASDVSLGSLTNDLQTKNAIVPNTFSGLRFGNGGTIDTAASSAQVQAVIGAGVYDASGAAAAAAVPSGMIAFIKTGACPTGWTEDDTLATYNILVTSTAAGDVGTHGGSNSYTPAGTATVGTLTAAAQTFTGTAAIATSAVSAGTPSGTVANGTIAWPVGVPTNASGAFTEGAISWPASVPAFTGSAGTVPAQTFTGNSVTSSAVSAGTPAGTNSGAAFSITTAAYTTGSGNFAAKAMGGTTLASGTTSITLSTQPTFAGSALATHTHTTTATGSNSTATFTPAGTIAWSVGVPTIDAGIFTQPTISWPVGVPTLTAAAFSGSALGTHTHTVTPAGTNGTSAVTGTINFAGTGATITPPYFKVIACAKN